MASLAPASSSSSYGPSAAVAAPAPVVLGPDEMEALCYDRFMQYSGFGDKSKAGEIDGALFVKLCKETGLINKACSKTDVDLVFTRVKPKTTRKLNYAQFLTALLYLAEKRFARTWREAGPEAAQAKAMHAIAVSPGPMVVATRAEFVKFHDDKSTYTGTHAKGGPSHDDARITLSNLLDRSPADARGRKF